MHKVSGNGCLIMKKYDEKYKLRAVQMIREDGMTVAQVVHELGISDSSLYRWVEEFPLEQYPPNPLRVLEFNIDVINKVKNANFNSKTRNKKHMLLYKNISDIQMDTKKFDYGNSHVEIFTLTNFYEWFIVHEGIVVAVVSDFEELDESIELEDELHAFLQSMSNFNSKLSVHIYFHPREEPETRIIEIRTSVQYSVSRKVFSVATFDYESKAGYSLDFSNENIIFIDRPNKFSSLGSWSRHVKRLSDVLDEYLSHDE